MGYTSTWRVENVTISLPILRQLQGLCLFNVQFDVITNVEREPGCKFSRTNDLYISNFPLQLV